MIEMEQESPGRTEQKNIERFAALSAIVREKRDEAIKYRQQSGVEEEWTLAEEQYEGIDDANRGTSNAATRKPTSMSGGLLKNSDSKDVRSTLLLNITYPYTNSATARIADMLLPQDELNYGVEPTPIPELDAAQDNTSPLVDDYGQPMMRGPDEEEAARGMQGQVQMTVADAAKQALAKAKDAAKAAEQQINDWHIESGFVSEQRKLIKMSGKLGVGVLKGPFPIKRKAAKVVMSEMGAQLQISVKVAPASKCISPWNLYPDPACGDNIHNGSFIVEHDEITRKQLRDLKGVDYIDAEIDACLEEGPQAWSSTDSTSGRRDGINDKSLYDIWYFYGDVKRSDLDAARTLHHATDEDVDSDSEEEKEQPDGDDYVYVQITLVNNRVVKVIENPLDSGEFPYDVFPWSERANSWTGYGLPHQIRAAQKIVTAATRLMLNNARLSAALLLGIKRGVINPMDGSWDINGDKIFELDEAADAQSIRDAMHVFDIPSKQVELQNIVYFGLKVAEDTTGQPMLMQGQMGQAPDTVGGMEILSNNAGVVPRDKARTFDESITEPHINRYYEFLMMYSDNDKAKGDFQIKARGSAVLVERALQSQAILQMGALVQQERNPFRVSPDKWFAEMARSQRLDPSKFLYDDEEWKKISEQPAPSAPQIEAAKIRAQVDTQKIKADTDRDTQYVQAETDRTQREHEARMAELSLKLELAQLDYASRNQMTLDDVKAKLTMKSMDIVAMKELSAIGAPANRLPKPPVEPRGRAPRGQSFQR